MSDRTHGDEIQVKISGGVSGQVAAGRHIRQQSIQAGQPTAVTDEDRASVQRLIAELKEQVNREVPDEQRDAALERVDELEEAVGGDEPDVTTMAYVRSWFGKHLPALAGAVTGLIVNPVIGKIVEAAGDLVADQFRQHFGGTPTASRPKAT